MTRSAQLAAVAMALWACLALISGAQRPPSDSVVAAESKALASELRCPVCQGESLLDSPSGLAQEMRGVIRDQLRAGRTPDQVKSYFIDKYGEWILLEPPARGFNLVVYAVPVLAVLAGLVVVWRAVRRWTARAARADGLPEAEVPWAEGESPTPESPTSHRTLTD